MTRVKGLCFGVWGDLQPGPAALCRALEGESRERRGARGPDVDSIVIRMLVCHHAQHHVLHARRIPLLCGRVLGSRAQGFGPHCSEVAFGAFFLLTRQGGERVQGGERERGREREEKGERQRREKR